VTGGRVLGDYVELQRGNTYKSALLDRPGPVLLGLASIARNGGFRRGSLRTYGGESDDRMLLRPGDVYVSLKDVTQSADLLGAVARVPRDVALGRLTQDTVKLKFRQGSDGDRGYVYWVLRGPDYRDYCRARAIGTTNLSLAREDFLGFPLRAPSLDDVAGVELLEALARALFKSWFVDFDPVRFKAEGRAPAGVDAATAALFAEGFERSDLEDFPRGWAHKSLYDCAEWVNGAAYRDFHFCDPGEGLPIVKIVELKAGITGQTKFTPTNPGDKYLIDTGDVLFSWSGNPDTSIDTFVWSRGKAWLNQHIFKVITDSRPKRTFLLRLLRHLRPVFAEIARNKQTTGLGHVTAGDMKRMNVAVPPPAILAAFHGLVGPLDDLMLERDVENRTLTNLRDALLPKLLSGELRVRDTDRIVERAV
jgi:type I restriction enzyme S subunit